MNIINLNQLKMEKSLKMYDLQEILKASGILPDGYKAENIQIVNGKICYERVEVKKSVENIVNDYRSKIIKTYFITADSYIDKIDYKISHKSYTNALYSYEKCEQILALEQLIMNCWIVNGCKELSRQETKAEIYRNEYDDEIVIDKIGPNYIRILNFTSLEIAQEFYETFRELIEIAKPLF